MFGTVTDCAHKDRGVRDPSFTRWRRGIGTRAVTPRASRTTTLPSARRQFMLSVATRSRRPYDRRRSSARESRYRTVPALAQDTISARCRVDSRGNSSAGSQ